MRESRPAGAVYLVGAGPGDPGLMTLRGAELLASADVVVHDRLTGPGLLSLARPGAELVDVGKEADDRGDQAGINRLLVDRATQGYQVVRLKGGDPFVFGRGGEEAMALATAGVPFEVVPGVTSAIAAPAYAGVPVTHRGMVTSFTVVAGHTGSLGPDSTNWEALAAAGGTIVVLMGAAHRAQVAERLMAGGRPATTPVLAVTWATQPEQSCVRTTLGALAAAQVAPPATIVIGEVAGLDLGGRTAAGARRPLWGRTVVVTRAAHQAPELSRGLRQAGARVVELPVIEVVAPPDGGSSLREAVGRVAGGTYAWVVFSSANAVDHFFALVPDARIMRDSLVAAVGPATAGALRRARIVPDLVPANHRSLGLVEAFPRPPGGGGPKAAVLLPQAAEARPELSAGLAALGWDVDTVSAYATRPLDVPAEALRRAGEADAICFASPSAVASFVSQAAASGAAVPPVVVCIGPVTAAAATSRGLDVTSEASEQSVEGLVGALVAALG